MVRFAIEFEVTRPIGLGHALVEADSLAEAEKKTLDLVKTHFKDSYGLISALRFDCTDSEELDETETGLTVLNQILDYEEYQEPNL